MKRAILIRHGETQRDQKTHEKVLSLRGRMQIQSTARQILGEFNPDLILYSPAIRTTESGELIREVALSMGMSPPLRPDEHLRTKQIPLSLMNADDACETIFFVTHEPEVIFTLDQCCKGVKAMTTIVPPACALVLESNAASWDEATTSRFILAKRIEAEG